MLAKKRLPDCLHIRRKRRNLHSVVGLAVSRLPIPAERPDAPQTFSLRAVRPKVCGVPVLVRAARSQVFFDAFGLMARANNFFAAPRVFESFWGARERARRKSFWS